MSSLKYYAYEKHGQNNLKQYGYQQSVRVGDRIECAGQGEILPLSLLGYILWTSEY